MGEGQDQSVFDVMQGYMSQMKEKEDALKVREDALSEKEQSVNQKATEVESKEQEIQTKEQELQSKEQALSSREIDEMGRVNLAPSVSVPKLDKTVLKEKPLNVPSHIPKK